MHDQTALVIGATGLVGGELLRLLLSDSYYQKIKVVTRREIQCQDPRLEQIVIPDFSQLDQHVEMLAASDYFCALGTTIKQAGSKAAFRQVDHDYPLALARLAHQHAEFRQYLIVTAAGANKGSMFFYNRVKGELEEALKKLELPALKVFRPSLLLGKRNAVRKGEQAAQVLGKYVTKILPGSKKAAIAITGTRVAKAMRYLAHQQKSGYEVISSQKMYKLAQKPI